MNGESEPFGFLGTLYEYVLFENEKMERKEVADEI